MKWDSVLKHVFFLLESAFPTELDFFWVDTWLSDSFKEGEEGLKLRILKDYEFLFWKKYVWICCILRNKQFKHKMNHLDKPKTGFVLQNSCYRNTKVNLQEENFFELLERGLETKMIMFLALYCCKQAWFFELTTLIKVFFVVFFSCFYLFKLLRIDTDGQEQKRVNCLERTRSWDLKELVSCTLWGWGRRRLSAAAKIQLPAGRAALSCHSVDVWACLVWDLGKSMFKFARRHLVWAWGSLYSLCLAVGTMERDALRAGRHMCCDRPLRPDVGFPWVGRSCCPALELASPNNVLVLSPCPCRADCASQPPDQGGREQPCPVCRRPHHWETERAGPIWATSGTLWAQGGGILTCERVGVLTVGKGDKVMHLPYPHQVEFLFIRNGTLNTFIPWEMEFLTFF